MAASIPTALTTEGCIAIGSQKMRPKSSQGHLLFLQAPQGFNDSVERVKDTINKKKNHVFENPSKVNYKLSVWS